MHAAPECWFDKKKNPKAVDLLSGESYFCPTEISSQLRNPTEAFHLVDYALQLKTFFQPKV